MGGLSQATFVYFRQRFGNFGIFWQLLATFRQLLATLWVFGNLGNFWVDIL
jgi:hypothetical protein